MKSFFFFAFFLSILRSSFAGNPDVIVCDSVPVSAFQELYVSSSINVILVNSNFRYAYIEGTTSSIASVQIKQIGRKLFISRKGSLAKGKLFVYVPIDFLRIINAADGAKVSSYDPVKGDTLLLTSSDQSSIKIMIEVNVVRSSSGENGLVELFGTGTYSFLQSDQNGASSFELKSKR